MYPIYRVSIVLALLMLSACDSSSSRDSGNPPNATEPPESTGNLPVDSVVSDSPSVAPALQLNLTDSVVMSVLTETQSDNAAPTVVQNIEIPDVGLNLVTPGFVSLDFPGAMTGTKVVRFEYSQFEHSVVRYHPQLDAIELLNKQNLNADFVDVVISAAHTGPILLAVARGN